MNESGAHNKENQQKREVIAIFGGTFDPIHNGHIDTISRLQTELDIELIRWMLSAKPPHKSAIGAETPQRLRMLEIALADKQKMRVDDTEVKRKGLSYTALTLEQLRQKHSNASLILIIGADSMHSFHTWRRAKDILGLANILVMSRPGYSVNPAAIFEDNLTNDAQALKENMFGHVLIYPTLEVDISSTQIRRLRLENKSITGLLPKRVEKYILENKLYLST